MKITDAPKMFYGEDSIHSIRVSQNLHEEPSVFFEIFETESGEDASYIGVNDLDTVKEIIEHMAKMAGLSVTFNDTSELAVGDTVEIIGGTDYAGQRGTVVGAQPNSPLYQYRVEFDGEDYEVFKRRELQKVLVDTGRDIG